MHPWRMIVSGRCFSERHLIFAIATSLCDFRIRTDDNITANPWYYRWLGWQVRNGKVKDFKQPTDAWPVGWQSAKVRGKWYAATLQQGGVNHRTLRPATKAAIPTKQSSMTPPADVLLVMRGDPIDSWLPKVPEGAQEKLNAAGTPMRLICNLARPRRRRQDDARFTPYQPS
ncbi:hypothetical protein MAPG_11499 [Magnaporthiopsis poae ATCC 64411]|uniref:Uncharacterized protein n=1 Tax=Magnaporthiopsis poae (strain ATCC 64411 / 73-15) TaxID=644358 RepID=A0A0C4EFF5_MAGP6|nr:hypothetical protein MAPG_11499 [Magnaporthiopsis poae ATCC 64411]